MAGVKSEFEIWLRKGNIKKQDPAFCIANLLEVSAYAMSKNMTMVGIFEIEDRKQFNSLRSKLLGNKIFRISNKSTYRAFEQTGKLYSDFLKQYTPETVIVDDIIDTRPSSPKQQNKIRKENERTITQAITEVLKETSPLTAQEIYERIVEKDLYRFGAKAPSSVVYNQLMVYCENQNTYAITSKNKLFRIVGKKGSRRLFALAGDNCATYKHEEKTELNELIAEVALDLDWDERVAENFQNWIVKLGKAENTAKSYRSAMSFVVRTFCKEWSAAKKQENALLGLKHFYNLIKNNENFIASNKVMHNAYRASIKAFYLFLSKDKEKSQHKDTDNKESQKTPRTTQIDEKAKIECIERIKATNLKGFKITSDNAHELGARIAPLKRTLKDCGEILEIEEDCWVHKNSFCDLEEAKSSFETIIKRHIGSLGLSTKPIFYDAIKLECGMFLNDNDLYDEDKIFRLASQLCKEEFFFYANFFISELGGLQIKSANDIGINIAMRNAGIVSKMEMENTFKQLKITQSVSQALGIYSGKNGFVLYSEDNYLHLPTLGILDSQAQAMRRAIDKLFELNPNEHFIIIRDIEESWFKTLPVLPHGKEWTPLLLQELLSQMSQIGYTTIKCLPNQEKSTIHAAIVPTKSNIKTLADIVWLYLESRNGLSKEYGAEELRQILKESGMISGNELIYTMPKALDDYRFAWINNNATVKVRG